MASDAVLERGGLAGESTEALRARLTSALARTAEDLREMATIVAELEARGEDLTTLRLGLVDHLRRIAAGQLLPELVVRLSGYPLLLRTAVALPLPDQQRLASGESLPLAVWRGDQVDWRQVDPLSLTPLQLRQLFSTSRIRSEAEQVALLEERSRTRPRAPRPRKASVRADAARGGIVVGRSFAAHGDVVRALAELGQADYDDDADGEASVVVRLPEAEHRQLKIRAARSGSSLQALIRRALAAAGLLSADRLSESPSTSHQGDLT